MHKHNFGQTLKNTKCCGYLEYKIKFIEIQLTLFCMQTLYQCKFDVEKFTGSEDRAQKRLILQFLKDCDHDNEVTLKTRSKSPKSYQLFILPQ